MASLSAIRYVAASSKSALGHIYLQCHVKPGARKQRQGIVSISENIIEVCVAAQAREGEANKAVRELFSVALKCPKSDVEVVRGLKSRDKTVAIAGIEMKGDGQISISDILTKLQSAIE
ncbi:hypothetical protein BJ875DRAFT_452580 [Amylocarpus encephaloides]|uniref:YggU-like protein n=1 Tax=Amylocarpus encephaloides TaxID=45428 RepID=A0A9P7YR40_9HELO|nr:hypothetical protein BJ875DRAFT_452580 [Amylocarpus encephaloides]